MMNNKENFIKQVESKKSRRKQKAHHTYTTGIHMRDQPFLISIRVPIKKTIDPGFTGIGTMLFISNDQEKKDSSHTEWSKSKGTGTYFQPFFLYTL